MNGTCNATCLPFKKPTLAEDFDFVLAYSTGGKPSGRELYQRSFHSVEYSPATAQLFLDVSNTDLPGYATKLSPELDIHYGDTGLHDTIVGVADSNAPKHSRVDDNPFYGRT